MQGKTDGELLSWLAGFLDGEGSFVIVRESGGRLQPRIQVANTHIATLSRVQEMLTRLGLPHYVGWKQGGRRADGYDRKRQWVIMATGLKRTARWCQALLEYLVTKREQAELMLEFCNSRLSHGNWQAPKDRRKALLPREAEVLERIRSANH